MTGLEQLALVLEEQRKQEAAESQRLEEARRLADLQSAMNQSSQANTHHVDKVRRALCEMPLIIYGHYVCLSVNVGQKGATA